MVPGICEFEGCFDPMVGSGPYCAAHDFNPGRTTRVGKGDRGVALGESSRPSGLNYIVLDGLSRPGVKRPARAHKKVRATSAAKAVAKAAAAAKARKKAAVKSVKKPVGSAGGGARAVPTKRVAAKKAGAVARKAAAKKPTKKAKASKVPRAVKPARSAKRTGKGSSRARA